MRRSQERGPEAPRLDSVFGSPPPLPYPGGTSARPGIGATCYFRAQIEPVPPPLPGGVAAPPLSCLQENGERRTFQHGQKPDSGELAESERQPFGARHRPLYQVRRLEVRPPLLGARGEPN